MALGVRHVWDGCTDYLIHPPICQGLAVMIGRAAIGNPWIFGRQERDQLPFHEITRAIRLHLHEMLAYHGRCTSLHPQTLQTLRQRPYSDRHDLQKNGDCQNRISESEPLASYLEAEFGVYPVQVLVQA